MNTLRMWHDRAGCNSLKRQVIDLSMRSRGRPAAGTKCGGAERPPKNCRSFTLIELLMVLAIIAILAALLMPALARAKESVMCVKCTSNLHQIWIAFDLYGQDHKRYPWSFQSSTITHWGYPLSPYFQKYGGVTSSSGATNLSPVLACPSAPIRGPANADKFHYSVNSQLLASDEAWVDHDVFPREYPFTERVAEVLLAADGVQDPVNGWSGAASFWWYPETWAAYDPATAETTVSPGSNVDDPSAFGQIRWRHKGNRVANFVFMDGHVQSLQINQLKEKHLKLSPPLHF